MTQHFQVTVVADDPGTGDALRSYLGRAGVASRATRRLDAARLPGASIAAVVIFPDEYGLPDVLTSIATLRARNPTTLLLLVTSSPRSFARALKPRGRSVLPVIFPKPVFGWTIVDTIRAHVEALRSQIVP